MIISRTPYRISFFGGGTDYPSWYHVHGGAVLAATIDKYCYLTCRYLPPFFEHRSRIVYSKIESCATNAEIAHPSVREVLRHLEIKRGIEIHHDGDLPARSGMGSSSAFTVGLLHAAYALQGQMPTKRQLADEAIYVEQEVLKETVGSQDQVMAAFGGVRHVQFLPGGDFSVRPITLPAPRLLELNDHLMLFYTGIVRTASDLAKSYVDDIHSKRRQLRIMKDLVEEGLSILNSGRELNYFGQLLHEAWLAKRSLSSQVSNSQVDELYERAQAAGAIGGKLTGAGGGGFMLLFVPPDRQEAVKANLDHLIHVPFRFEPSGSQIIFYEPGVDYSAEDEARSGKCIEKFRELTVLRRGLKRLDKDATDEETQILREQRVERNVPIYIAGGQTLIGSALVRLLKSQGFTNVVGAPPDEPNLCSASAVDEFFRRNRPRYVIFAAGKSGGIQANRSFPADLMLDNLLSECHVIDAAHRYGVKKLLYLASSCSYPKHCPQPMGVESLWTGPLEPTNDAYAAAKLAGINLCQAYARQHVDNFVCGIPANAFGIDDDFTPEGGHVIPALIGKIHRAKIESQPTVSIWGSGTPRREFIFADDLADACLFVLREYSETQVPINLGSGIDLSIRETAEQIRDVVGYRGELVFDSSKPDGMPLKSLDSAPLTRLGWRARTPIIAALNETYDAFLQREATPAREPLHV